MQHLGRGWVRRCRHLCLAREARHAQQAVPTLQTAEICLLPPAVLRRVRLGHIEACRRLDSAMRSALQCWLVSESPHPPLEYGTVQQTKWGSFVQRQVTRGRLASESPHPPLTYDPSPGACTLSTSPIGFLEIQHDHSRQPLCSIQSGALLRKGRSQGAGGRRRAQT